MRIHIIDIEGIGPAYAEKLAKAEIKTVEKLLLSHYLDKINIMAFDKKETEEINRQRTLEVKEFIKTLIKV